MIVWKPNISYAIRSAASGDKLAFSPPICPRCCLLSGKGNPPNNAATSPTAAGSPLSSDAHEQVNKGALFDHIAKSIDRSLQDYVTSAAFKDALVDAFAHQKFETAVQQCAKPSVTPATERQQKECRKDIIVEACCSAVSTAITGQTKILADVSKSWVRPQYPWFCSIFLADLCVCMHKKFSILCARFFVFVFRISSLKKNS